MSNHVEGSAVSVSDRKDKDIDSDTPHTLPAQIEDIEKTGISAAIDKETERRLLKKLDIRIIPMVCWTYLVSR